MANSIRQAASGPSAYMGAWRRFVTRRKVEPLPLRLNYNILLQGRTFQQLTAQDLVDQSGEIV